MDAASARLRVALGLPVANPWNAESKSQSVSLLPAHFAYRRCRSGDLQGGCSAPVTVCRMWQCVGRGREHLQARRADRSAGLGHARGSGGVRQGQLEPVPSGITAFHCKRIFRDAHRVLASSNAGRCQPAGGQHSLTRLLRARLRCRRMCLRRGVRCLLKHAGGCMAHHAQGADAQLHVPRSNRRREHRAEQEPVCQRGGSRGS